MPAKESEAACDFRLLPWTKLFRGKLMFWDLRAGRVIVLILALAVLALTGIGLNARYRKRAGKQFFSVKTLTYSAICIAISLILSRFKLFAMPQGGDVTPCSMFFITLAGYWFGPAAGILAGVSEGLLRFALSATGSVGPVQILLDFPLAFGALGVAGFLRHMKFGLFAGYIAGALCLFCMSFLSGFLFWASYAPDGMNPVLYSAVYNLSYVLPEMGITIALLLVPQFRKAIDRIKAGLAT